MGQSGDAGGEVDSRSDHDDEHEPAEELGDRELLDDYTPRGYAV